MKRKIGASFRAAMAGAGVGLALSLALAGCKGERPKAGPIAVEFWHAMGGESGRLINELAVEFNAANPEVWILPRYQGGYSQFSQKLMASVIAGTNPPLAQMYSNWTTRCLALGRLRPMEDFFAGPQGLSREEVEDFFPAFLADNEWEGRIATLPFNKSAYLAYYNTQMLKAAGFEAPPRTWIEFRRAARAMTRAAPGQPKVFGFGLRPRLEIFTALFYSADGRYLTADSRAPQLGPEAGATLLFLNELIGTDQSVYVDDDYPDGPFAAGRIGSFFSTSASMPYVNKVVAGRFEWITAPLPTPDGQPGPTLFQGTNLGIFANHPEAVQQAAWRFVRFLTAPKTTARWAMGTGFLPVRLQALSDGDFQAFLEANPNCRTAVEQIGRARFEPKPDYWDRARRTAEDLVAECLYGRVGPGETLERMRREIQGMIDYAQAP